MSEDNNFLNKLRGQKPDEMQVHNWKAAVRNELHNQDLKSKYSFGYFVQLFTSVCIGVAIGAFIFSQPKNKSMENADFDFDDATVEVIYTKLK